MQYIFMNNSSLFCVADDKWFHSIPSFRHNSVSFECNAIKFKEIENKKIMEKLKMPNP